MDVLILWTPIKNGTLCPYPAVMHFLDAKHHPIFAHIALIPYFCKKNK